MVEVVTVTTYGWELFPILCLLRVNLQIHPRLISIWGTRTTKRHSSNSSNFLPHHILWLILISEARKCAMEEIRFILCLYFQVNFKHDVKAYMWKQVANSPAPRWHTQPCLFSFWHQPIKYRAFRTTTRVFDPSNYQRNNLWWAQMLATDAHAGNWTQALHKSSIPP